MLIRFRLPPLMFGSCDKYLPPLTPNMRRSIYLRGERGEPFNMGKGSCPSRPCSPYLFCRAHQLLSTKALTVCHHVAASCRSSQIFTAPLLYMSVSFQHSLVKQLHAGTWARRLHIIRACKLVGNLCRATARNNYMSLLCNLCLYSYTP